MKRYAIELTHTANHLNKLYPQGYQEKWIRKAGHVVKAEDFYKAPAFWSEYLYTSKKRAERSMKTMRGISPERYWDSSFRVVEVEINE